MNMQAKLKKTILVIDDDAINLSTAKRFLENDYTIIGVTSAMQGLTVLERRIPDLILLDIQMPYMDGFDFMSEIRVNEVYRTIPVIFLTADRDPKTEAHCLDVGASDFISKPFEPRIMLSRVSRCIELSSFQKNLQGVLKDKTRQLEKMQYEFTREMAEIVEGRDENTGGHIRRTCCYVEMTAHQMRKRGLYTEALTDEYIDHLVQAANIHDLGKIRISDTILNKPGRLTPEEFDIMKQHVAYGGEMVEKLFGNWEDKEYFNVTKNLVCYHHEKWNGEGYLAGLKGEEIPLEARIMAIADVFDALISKRCYKEPMSIDKAFDIIRESSGTHFDPAIAEVFVEMRPYIETWIESGSY